MGSLEGMRVIVTRPKQQAEKLCRAIELAGGCPIRWPALEIQAITETGELGRIRAQLDSYNSTIFISTNAVDHALLWLGDRVTDLAGLRLFAVGAGTAERLKSAGLNHVLFSKTGAGSEGLLALSALQQDQISGERILIFRGEGGRELLARSLRMRGAVVDYAEVYRRLRPVDDDQTVTEVWERNNIDFVIITSGEGLQNLYDMIRGKARQKLLSTPVLTVSKRVAELAENLGFVHRPVIADNASDDALLRALMEQCNTGTSYERKE